MQNHERVWQKYKQPNQPETFKVVRNKYFRLIHAIRMRYYQEEFVKHKGNSKALYNLVSKLTGTENTNIYYQINQEVQNLQRNFLNSPFKRLRRSRVLWMDIICLKELD